MSEAVKVYTVNGASGSASSLPDWLTRKKAINGKGKHSVRERVEGSIDLIQHFEFPEASNRVRTTRDGHHAIATGVYKPQMRVWDLDQLTLKFERHSDVENVDFLILSDDWTKTLHLQTDRTIEVHTQGGFHHRVRIPHFGRSLAYHFPSCDALIAASGSEVYRLNLDQGRFMVPLDMSSGDAGDIAGVNVANVNPAHHLFSFGIEGNSSVQFWDPRARSRVGTLRLPASSLTVPGSAASMDLSVTAIASRSDGLSYAVGTSTGHILLYDVRTNRPFATKDQGYGLPIKCVQWVEGGGRMAGEGMIISADKKVVKIWDRNSANANFASVTPPTDINDLHHIPGSGLIMLANEGIQMTAYYIPQLGPAPRWCSFLDNITEELEDQSGRSVYEDFKFVERSELTRLGLDHLVGTPALKPYMHGYFLSLKLFDAARVIANPYVHAEHREKLVKEKMEKLSESRIRARKDAPKVNKALAEKIRREEERELKKIEKRRKQKGKDVAAEERQENHASEGKPSLLTDERFKALFEDPEFQVDTTTREYALLNPSAMDAKRRKTAVEDEEEESDKISSDGLDEDTSSSDEDSQSNDSMDNNDAKNFNELDSRTHLRKPDAQNPRNRVRQKPRQPRFTTVRPQMDGNHRLHVDKNATFGERLKANVTTTQSQVQVHGDDGVMEMSWIPTESAEDDEQLSEERGGRQKGKKRKIGGMESFGAGMEKGAIASENVDSANRSGRTKRRTGVRSGSRNAFRNL